MKDKSKNQTTSKKVKFKGTAAFINASTGELMEMQVTDIEDRDFNFHKLWLKNVINTLDLVGNQKTRLAFWIIEHLDKENQLTLTYRQICEEYQKSEQHNISLDTVVKTMKILLDSDFMRRKNSGCYIINPDVIFKGTRTGRLNVLNQFHNAEKVELTKSEKIHNLNENILSLQKAIKATQDEIQRLQNEPEDEGEKQLAGQLEIVDTDCNLQEVAG